jgi:hypothetical protein
MQDVFEKHGVKRVDFMSLDVEGHEEEVCRSCLDLAKCTVHRDYTETNL